MQRSSAAGFALVFILGTLALMSVLGLTFFSVTSMEQRIARNYLHETEVRLLAESGVEYAIGRLQELQGGPITEEQYQMLGTAHPEQLAFAVADPARGRDFSMPVARRGVFDATVELQVSDESGKLNINDPHRDIDGIQYTKRLENVFAVLADSIRDSMVGTYDGESLATHLFQHPSVGRVSYPGDRFPDWNAVERCLLAFGLSQSQSDVFQRFVTLDSWRDGKVLRVDRPIYGEDRLGITLTSQKDRPIGTWLHMQTYSFQLDARAPVNINTAPVELIQALIQPLQGMFLREGPCETQSSEHYGWWATGLNGSAGALDTRVYELGVLMRTLEFTPTMADRLARAIHDRVHATAENADLAAGQQDPLALGSGIVPNPFETWEEFRDFLRNGIAENRRNEIFLGSPAPDSICLNATASASPLNFTDPHQITPTVPVTGFNNRYQTYAGNATVIPAWEENTVRHWWEEYWIRRQQDLLYANFNPNSLLNDFNPNENIHLEIDKPQILLNTTEFCFEPTGVFRIRSAGSLLQPRDMTVIARRTVTCSLKLFELLRHTTQSDFLRGLESVDQLPDFFSMAEPYERMEPYNAGYAITCQAHRIGEYRPALQSYPESLAPGREALPARQRYDGCLMPATLESDATRHGPLFYSRLNGAVGGKLQDVVEHQPRNFLRRGDLSAHTGGGNRFSDGPLMPRHTSSDAVPGAVYPDGAYSENGRVLAYKFNLFNAVAADRGLRGGLGFWIKPNFHMGMCHRIRKFLSGPSRPGIFARQTMPAMYYLSNPATPSSTGIERFGSPMDPWMNLNSLYGDRRNTWIPTRCLAFGWAWCNHAADGTFTPQQWINSYQFDYSVSKVVNEDFPKPDGYQGYQMSVEMRGHHWTYLSCSWKLSSAAHGGTATWRAQLSLPTLLNHSPLLMRYGTYRNNQYIDTDRSIADDLSAEWLRFGELPAGNRGIDSADASASPYHADSTIDEICGIGDPIGVSPLLPDLHVTGRYYRHATAPEHGPLLAAPTRLGSYTSAVLLLHRELAAQDCALRLRSSSWTYYWPRNNRVYDPQSGKYLVADTVIGAAINPNDARDPMMDAWAADADIDRLHPQDYPTVREWDPIAVDFRVDRAGSLENSDWHFQNARALEGTAGAPPMFTYAGGSIIRADKNTSAESITLRPGDAFRYQINIHLASELNYDFQLYEAPVLDDITFTFWRGRPLVLRWLEE